MHLFGRACPGLSRTAARLHGALLPSEFFDENVAGPLGADFRRGLDAQTAPRCAPIIPPPRRSVLVKQMGTESSAITAAQRCSRRCSKPPRGARNQRCDQRAATSCGEPLMEANRTIIANWDEASTERMLAAHGAHQLHCGERFAENDVRPGRWPAATRGQHDGHPPVVALANALDHVETAHDRHLTVHHDQRHTHSHPAQAIEDLEACRTVRGWVDGVPHLAQHPGHEAPYLHVVINSESTKPSSVRR